MAEQNLFCLCGRCSRKLRSAAARRVGMGSTCCRKERSRSDYRIRGAAEKSKRKAAFS